MKCGLVVGQDSRRHERKIKFFSFIMVLGLAAILWPAPNALGTIPPRNGKKLPARIKPDIPHPDMGLRISQAQKQRPLTGPSLAAIPPIRGNHPLLMILIEGTTATLPFGNYGMSAQYFNPQLRDPNFWVGYRQKIDAYYNEVSRGILRFVPAKETFGALNDGIVGPVAVRDLVTTITDVFSPLLRDEAIRAANPYVNFAQFDTNFDGDIDGDELHLIIIQAGINDTFPLPGSGAAAWPHMQASPFMISRDPMTGIYSVDFMGFPTLIPAFDCDNMTLSSYIYMAAEDVNTGIKTPVGWGTFCHELGHDIGLPDLYSYSYTWAGLGLHSLMSAGNYGEDFTCTKPTHIDGMLKSYLFWAQETNVMAPTNKTFTLPASVGTNAVLRVNIPNSTEFYIIENRQQIGFDTGLPGTQGGLAIFHCDDSAIWGFYANIPGMPMIMNAQMLNWDPVDFGMKMLQADGSASLMSPFAWGTDGDYFRSGLNTTCNRLTNPNTLLKSTLPSGMEISNVSASGPMMSFTLSHGNVLGFTTNFINVREEQGRADIIVKMNAPAENACSVDFAAIGGTASPLGVDFNLPSGTLTFEPGATTKFFSIGLNNDAIANETENVMLLLRNPKGAILNTTMSTMLVNILDNDNPALNLVKPNGGEQIKRGGTYRVEWITNPEVVGREVRIDLYKGSGYYMTLPGCFHVPNTSNRNYNTSWTVTLPSTLPVGTDYRVAVTAVFNESYSDLSDGNISIIDPGLRVTALKINGGITPVTSRKVTLEIIVPAGLQFSHYIASESSTFAGAVWQAFGPSLPFTLSPGDGTKRIYLKIRNSGGQESAPISAATVLKEIPSAPVIATIPEKWLTEHKPYISVTPRLTDGDTPPIYWSLVSGPPGVTINPSSGVVTWNDPKVANSPATITIRATNSIGSGTTSWRVIVIAGDLNNAVETSGWAWNSTGGNAGWGFQSGVSHDGADAARSRVVGNSQKAVMATTLTGPGMLGFWWKVSSEANFDKLNFQINGKLLGSISGAKDWAYVSARVPAGPCTLTWTYAKDAANAAGLDAGFVDQLTWQPGMKVFNITRAGYVLDSVAPGKLVWGGSTATFTSSLLAIFNGQTMIRTLSKDRNYVGSSMLGFYVDQPVNLVLAMDNRFTALPSWATGFTKLPQTIQTSTNRLNLYARRYPAGKIVLGGTSNNGNPSNYSMYGVILIPANQVAMSSLSNPAYVTSTVNPGMRVTADTGYVFKTPISPLCLGAGMIRTRQADQLRAGASFLSFILVKPATILVGFDSRMSAPPSWAAGWQYQGESISATDGPRKLYARTFAPGRVTLGGNVNPGVTTKYNMYTVIAIPNN